MLPLAAALGLSCQGSTAVQPVCAEHRSLPTVQYNPLVVAALQVYCHNTVWLRPTAAVNPLIVFVLLGLLHGWSHAPVLRRTVDISIKSYTPGVCAHGGLPRCTCASVLPSSFDTALWRM
jgi:ABC-type anion transport system duplicated permease subunit